ncbi:hypothetical protein VTP01DRAFT_9896 [Rhizomucor pusillus]|uniref:uncharacterized protein n=1 Tax=Rhizomucor pusillus TaxID=4840 RepID=UPI003742DCBD
MATATAMQQRAFGSIDADFFIESFYYLPPAQAGVSQTINHAIHQYCKNLENMWADKLFSRLGFQKSKREKRVQGSVKISAIRNLQRNKLYEENKYLRKTESRIMQAGDEHEEARWFTRRYKCQRRIHAINEVWQKRLDRKPQDAIVQFAAGDSANHGWDERVSELLKHGLEEEEIIEILEQHEEDSTEEEEHTEEVISDQPEPSRKRLNRLKGICKSLLFSTTMVNEITEQDVTSACYDDLELSSKETQIIAFIANLLRPFLQASNGKKNRSIADTLPFVLFANTLLRTCRYPEFTAQISPTISPAKIQSLTLPTIDVSISIPPRMKKITNIRKTRENKEVMIGSSLDIDKIKRICEESGLHFQNRAILTSFGIVRLTAGQQETKDDIFNMDLEVLNEETLSKEAVYKMQKKERKEAIAVCEHATLDMQQNDIQKFQELKELRLKRTWAIIAAHDPTKKKMVPTLRNFACESSPANITISTLEKEAYEARKPIVYSRTDYGLQTMSTTVPMTADRLNYHSSLYNRFDVLSIADDEIPIDTHTDDTGTYMEIPKSICITAPQLNKKPLSNQHSRLLNIRWKPHEQLKMWLLRANQDGFSGLFISHLGRKKEKRNQELATKIAYSQVAAQERRAIKNDAGDDKAIPVMFIGNQGAGIESRLKGHTRRGGKKLLKDHCRHAAVATTDEFRSSKPCPFCFPSKKKA